MTLRDLLQENTTWVECFQLIQIKYEEISESLDDVPDLDSVRKGYTQLIMKLLAYPYNPHDYIIQLDTIPVDDFNPIEYIDVALVDPIRSLTDDLSSLPWGEVIDLEIDLAKELLTITDSQVLSEILWELTTWGFDSEITDNKKDLYSYFLAGFLRDDLDKN